MQIIYVDASPFTYRSKVFLIDSENDKNNKTLGSIRKDELATSICIYAREENVYDVVLGGSATFRENLKNEIEKENITTYSDNKLIKVMSINEVNI